MVLALNLITLLVIVLPLVFALVILVVFLAVRSIVAQAGQLGALISSGLDVVEAEVQKYASTDADLTSNVRATITSGLGLWTRFAVGGLFSILPATLELLSAGLLTVVILFFLLKDGEQIWGWATGQFPMSATCSSVWAGGYGRRCAGSWRGRR